MKYSIIPLNSGTLLRDMGLAAKRINAEVNRAGLADIIGDTNVTNVQV